MLPDIDYHPRQGLVADESAYQTRIPAAPLSRWVACFWQLNVPEGGFDYRSVPDNSVDLIVNLHDAAEVFIVKPGVSPQVFGITGPVAYFGIRFRLLGYQGLIQTPLGAWDSDHIATELAGLLPESILHAIHHCAERPLSFDARCAEFSALILGSVRCPDIDPRLARFIRHNYRNLSSQLDVSDRQCAEFGISARQLRRLSQLYLGVLPGEFARVLRFQRMLQQMSASAEDRQWADYYYDQSHFIREFKRLSGLTPRQFSSMSVLYNTPHDH